jgi:4-amino-4-deoxychorismate lyase
VSALLESLLNGVGAEAVPTGSRAIHYGDGVFRTLLRKDGVVLDVDGQFAKLQADAERIGLSLDRRLRSQLLHEVENIAHGTRTAVLKLMLVRGGGGRGYMPTANSTTDRYVLAYTAPSYPAACWDSGIVAERSEFMLGDQPALAGIKHLNRLEQVMAYRSASTAADEVLLQNAQRQWVCGGRSNLFIVIDGILITPPLERQGVAGRMRERVLETAAKHGFEYRIKAVPDSLLSHAAEVFITNSLIGIWPVRQLNRQLFSVPGPVTGKLAHVLAHPRLTDS